MSTTHHSEFVDALSNLTTSHRAAAAARDILESTSAAGHLPLRAAGARRVALERLTEVVGVLDAIEAELRIAIGTIEQQ
ncbi:hypothetical protein IU500_08400 [Nocardia terpenica]|uniref:hypothetical protein n=1 Tax=Nocardia terpenica TaxID=455432 RepID=UPI0018941DA1|nr:hypothetical protein [Nocardia terpenica]MBF6060797.1 hypothetical protein [Nocardia terpenica]MBF6104057.1 hypothetical protein [Nocardia terpenica]MBF6111569.1 hypothetical protein [Nocardia terpenica]MBF6118278.1 hypothetical protein [Nocardia terpenica]MBF6156097.1 hypothetical protein [Nocardia terpenica]